MGEATIHPPPPPRRHHPPPPIVPPLLRHCRPCHRAWQEPAEAFFLVTDGAVQMSYTASDGRQLPSKTHRAGDVFGASGLLAGASTRRDTAIALAPTTVKLFPHARFHALVRQDSMIAEGIRRVASTQPAAAAGASAQRYDG